MPDPDIPEFYVDQFRVNLNAFGTLMTFGLSGQQAPGGQVPVKDLVQVRMSLEHMKVMTMILRRQLKGYEEQAAPINIPAAVYNSLGLSQEDW